MSKFPVDVPQDRVLRASRIIPQSAIRNPQ